jgi:hypothetical protein
MADSTPSAPNRRPVSEPCPSACKQTAPKECRAGFPPDVNDDRQLNAIKATSDEAGEIVTKRSARASTDKEACARRLSNWSSRATLCGDEAPVTGILGLK